jgi:hypothetical protein
VITTQVPSAHTMVVSSSVSPECEVTVAAAATSPLSPGWEAAIAPLVASPVRLGRYVIPPYHESIPLNSPLNLVLDRLRSAVHQHYLRPDHDLPLTGVTVVGALRYVCRYVQAILDKRTKRNERDAHKRAVYKMALGVLHSSSSTDEETAEIPEALAVLRRSNRARQPPDSDPSNIKYF